MNLPQLNVVMYHYVRDLPNTEFPKIKGLLSSDFRKQLAFLKSEYEIATLESALAFLAGDYEPKRDMCLLTFDDGLKEHFHEVTPLLVEEGIQGQFFLITDCMENGRVATVHMNHFLMATLNIDYYSNAYLESLRQLVPDLCLDVEDETAQRVYRWDSLAIGKFKYALNFLSPTAVREQIISELFRETFGDERTFADQLYVSWSDAQTMIDAGQVIGGHTHRHLALAQLTEEEQRVDLTESTDLLHRYLNFEYSMPFSYPYGKPGSAFTKSTSELVRELGYSCAFSTEVGENSQGQDPFSIRRIDTKDVASVV